MASDRHSVLAKASAQQKHIDRLRTTGVVSVTAPKWPTRLPLTRVKRVPRRPVVEQHALASWPAGRAAPYEQVLRSTTWHARCGEQAAPRRGTATSRARLEYENPAVVVAQYSEPSHGGSGYVPPPHTTTASPAATARAGMSVGAGALAVPSPAPPSNLAPGSRRASSSPGRSVSLHGHTTTAWSLAKGAGKRRLPFQGDVELDDVRTSPERAVGVDRRNQAVSGTAAIAASSGAETRRLTENCVCAVYMTSATSMPRRSLRWIDALSKARRICSGTQARARLPPFPQSAGWPYASATETLYSTARGRQSFRGLDMTGHLVSDCSQPGRRRLTSSPSRTGPASTPRITTAPPHTTVAAPAHRPSTGTGAGSGWK